MTLQLGYVCICNQWGGHINKKDSSWDSEEDEGEEREATGEGELRQLLETTAEKRSDGTDEPGSDASVEAMPVKSPRENERDICYFPRLC